MPIFRNNYVEGQKLGELIFLHRTESTGKPSHLRSMAKFRCECGKEFICRIETAKNRRTKSCGCKSAEFNRIASTRHEPVKYIESGRKLIPIFTDEMINRFWGKIEVAQSGNICWNWKRVHKSHRYGAIRVGRAMYKANRVAYFLHYKTDPLDLEVMHSCDNPKCCNPTHLSLGTHVENMQDMVDKGRARNQYVGKFY